MLLAYSDTVNINFTPCNREKRRFFEIKMKFVIGKKIGMTRIFQNDSCSIPVTILNISENFISQIKNPNSDGYSAYQVSFGKKKNLSKSVKNHLQKSGIKSSLKIKEFRVDQIDPKLKVGLPIDINIFQPGDFVNLQAKSKGKGFSGTVKRYHFKIGPISHGSNNQRKPGSIGATTPAHVIKGRRMPGHKGFKNITLKKIEIIDVLPADSILLLRGSIPGPRNSIIKLWSE